MGVNNDDPLKELLVDSAEVDRQAIATALKGVVGVDPKAKAVVTQPDFDRLNGRQQVVALLLGAKVAHLLGVLDTESLASREVIAQSGMAGGTARPVLRELAANRLISQDAEGRYFIAHHQVASALGRLAGSRDSSPTPKKASRVRVKKVAEKDKPSAPAKRRSSSGVGPAITALVDSGFFAKPRTLRDVQERLKKKKGINVELPALSPILLRLLRSETLDREQNDDGVYEYFTTHS